MSSIIWKILKEFPDYEINNRGILRSLKRKKIVYLKLRENNKGYIYCDLCTNGIKKRKYIHILVYETFKNEILKSSDFVHHRDENPKNNYIENLEKMSEHDHKSFHMSGIKNPMFNVHRYGTENTFYGKHHSEDTKKILSYQKRGDKNPRSKLTKENIIEIIKLLTNKFTCKKIAEKFKVSLSTIYLIKNKRSWN